MIYKEMPKNWKDLQDKVHNVFSIIGYESYSPYQLTLVRGSKEVDVYAINKFIKPEQTILVECKYWETSIPQNEVLAFRSVVSDSGANIGIIISKNGFQKGCFEVIDKTNIILLTWNEFNSLYTLEFFKETMLKQRKYFELFTDYTEPVNSRIEKSVDKLSEKHQQKYYKLKNKYMGLGILIINYSYGMIDFLKDLTRYTYFPIKIPIDFTDENNIICELAGSVEEFIAIITEYHDKAMIEFNEVFNNQTVIPVQ